ncbi:hypothetical protein WJX72_008729 [[Myrmecia] bisecta]|uniref:Thioredoxin domain-containing protein n=1 Tax=[Myrmecia] bisecta TaxID=41462 RepID=A0AAW1PXU6_9CHLO
MPATEASKAAREADGMPGFFLQPPAGFSLLAARTDSELRGHIRDNKDKTVVVKFGSSWCAHCHEMFPHFYRFSKEFPENKYVVAQLDYMDVESKGITYTPTYTFYKQGKKVDEFFGSNPQQLRDHIWLHTDT